MNIFQKAKEIKKDPSSVDRYDLKEHDDNGFTLAHILAEHNLLPEGFTDYLLADNGGTTVAHIVAAYGKLPPNFLDFDAADQYGCTVADVLSTRNTVYSSCDH